MVLLMINVINISILQPILLPNKQVSTRIEIVFLSFSLSSIFKLFYYVSIVPNANVDTMHYLFSMLLTFDLALSASITHDHENPTSLEIFFRK